jgi:hypothetical protein
VRQRSRGRCRPSFAKTETLRIARGCREGRVSTDTRGPRADKNARGRNHRLSRKHPAFPARWFDDLLRALPGDRALLPPSSQSARCALQDLAPASGRQDHTAWPSAKAFVREQRDRLGTGPVAILAKADQLVRRRQNACKPSRPPLPASTFVTIAKRPSS